jgi:methylmalonyl-CoA/ethylmalonyl-CoA epimerase
LAELNGDLLRLHHLGFVVSSIDETVRSFARSVNGSWDEQVFHDPIQKVKVTFLLMPGTDVQMELIEPADGQSPVRAFLEKGGGLHHLCYEVEDCERSIIAMRKRGSMIVKRAKPAVAFQGRRIAWVMTSEKLLIELLEGTAK